MSALRLLQRISPRNRSYRRERLLLLKKLHESYGSMCGHHLVIMDPSWYLTTHTGTQLFRSPAGAVPPLGQPLYPAWAQRLLVFQLSDSLNVRGGNAIWGWSPGPL
jgi:hypothetical protein